MLTHQAMGRLGWHQGWQDIGTEKMPPLLPLPVLLVSLCGLALFSTSVDCFLRSTEKIDTSYPKLTTQ